MGDLFTGDAVPLTLQLEDGDVTKFPQAEVRDPTGSLLTTLDLSHVGSGNYTNSSLTMPDEDWITITYIVYNEVGHTTESASHLRAQADFAREDPLSRYMVGGHLAVTFDSVNGAPGTVPGVNGTVRNPTDDEASARTIAAAIGSSAFNIRRGSYVLGASYAGAVIFSESRNLDLGAVVINSQDVTGAAFKDVTIAGDLAGTAVSFERCALVAITGLIGDLLYCSFSGSIAMAGPNGGTTLQNCIALNPGGASPPVFDFGAVTNGTFTFRQWSGSFKLVDITNALISVSVGMVGGGLAEVDSTCTAGVIDLDGQGTPLNNTGAGGAIVNDNLLDAVDSPVIPSTT